jgi:glycosyltransferase involved in cell wall biosynthesis
MKILIIDQFSQRQHLFFNKGILTSLLKIPEVEKIFIIGSKSAFPQGVSEKVSFIDTHNLKMYGEDLNGIRGKLKNVTKLHKCARIANNLKVDLVIFFSYETVSLSLASFFFSSPVLAFNHYNVDDFSNEILKSRIKFFLISHLAQKVALVSLEDFITDHLKTVGLKNKLFTLPHPILDDIVEKYTRMWSNTNHDSREHKEYYVIFIPSGSSSKNFLNNFFSQEMVGLKIYAKYDKQIKTDAIQTKPFFDDEEYYKIMKSCDFVFIPFNENFNYRVSGVFYEAVSFGKHVLVTNSKFSEFMKEKYPYLVSIVECLPSKNYLDSLYHSIYSSKQFRENWNKFVEEHSLKRRTAILREILVTLLTKQK